MIGAGLEFLLGDCSNMFQRFGSIVVCIGIVFGTLDIKSIYIEKYDQLKKNTDEKRLENDIVFSDNELD